MRGFGERKTQDGTKHEDIKNHKRLQTVESNDPHPHWHHKYMKNTKLID